LTCTSLFFACVHRHPPLHSFPTRRSSDLFGQSGRSACQPSQRNAPSSAPHTVVRHQLGSRVRAPVCGTPGRCSTTTASGAASRRSEEHTSELQSRENLVCRLLLEKKNRNM